MVSTTAIQSPRKARGSKARQGRQRKLVRVAVIDGDEASGVEDVEVRDWSDVQKLSDRVLGVVRGFGGRVPAVAIREVVANLIHADFAGATVTVMARGNRVVVADQGSGIADTERAVEAGYSTATAAMRQHIRGVGAGLPLARAALESVNASLTVDSNLEGGTVVVLDAAEAKAPPAAGEELTDLQKRTLALLREAAAAGPTVVHRELSVGLGTAHRTLCSLEERGLAIRHPDGKRRLSDKGQELLTLIFGS